MPKRRHQHNPLVKAIACGWAALAVLTFALFDPAIARDGKNGKNPGYRGSGQAYEGSGAVGLPTRIPGIGTYAGALAGIDRPAEAFDQHAGPAAQGDVSEIQHAMHRRKSPSIRKGFKS